MIKEAETATHAFAQTVQEEPIFQGETSPERGWRDINVKRLSAFFTRHLSSYFTSVNKQIMFVRIRAGI